MLSGCGCLRPAPAAGITRVEYRDSLVYVKGATLRDTIALESVRFDTLTKLLTITVRDTIRVREQDGLRITTRIGQAGIVTEAVKLDTSIVFQTQYTEKIVYMPEPAADRWAWWKWVSIGFAAGLILALFLAKR